MIYLAALLAEIAGVEAIIGAFFAGLALNRLIPHTSALMNRVEFVGNAIFIPFFLISAPFPPRVRHNMGVLWAVSNVKMLTFFIGLRYQVKGTENIPTKPSIICCKHQSGWKHMPYRLFSLIRFLCVKKSCSGYLFWAFF